MASTTTLHDLPPYLLYDVLTAGPTALLNPGLLRLVSRKMCRSVDVVWATPGYWNRLSRTCFPAAADRLPADSQWMLQTGRYGPADDPKTVNRAWRANYERILRGLSCIHVRVW